MKVQRAIVVTLMSALASHFKVLRQSFYVMGKALSSKLSCAGTGLVSYGCTHHFEKVSSTGNIIYHWEFFCTDFDQRYFCHWE